MPVQSRLATEIRPFRVDIPQEAIDELPQEPELLRPRRGPDSGRCDEPLRNPGQKRCAPGRGSPARLRPCDRLAQLGAAHRGRRAREGRARRLLDVHVHQLAPHPRLRARVGRQVPEARAGRRRRPHPGVPVREGRRQRPRGAWRSMDVRYPVALDSEYGVWRAFAQPVLAGRVHRRRAGPDPAPPVRGGRVRGVRARRPAAAARGRRREDPRRPRLRRRRGVRGPGRLGEPEDARELPRLRAGPEPRSG